MSNSIFVLAAALAFIPLTGHAAPKGSGQMAPAVSQTAASRYAQWQRLTGEIGRSEQQMTPPATRRISPPVPYNSASRYATWRRLTRELVQLKLTRPD